MDVKLASSRLVANGVGALASFSATITGVDPDGSRTMLN